MFKKTLSILIAVIMLASAITGVSADREDTYKFSDVPSEAWFSGYVQAVREKGLMAGVSDTEFAPDKNVTRAMFVSVLYRLDGEPDASDSLPFNDVSAGSYYEKPAKWAYKNGIVSGLSDTEFAPDSEITKEQIAAILLRYAEYQGVDTKPEAEDLALPKDMDSVSDWAKDGVTFCFADGILHGDENAFLNPRSFATRSEMSAILVNSADLGNTLIAIPQKVKNGSDAAIAFIHDDGGKATGNWLNTVLPKYNVNATVAIIGKSINPEYNVNEPDNFEKWQVILKNSNGRLNFAVHSHGHRYLGETDEAETGVFPDGKEFSYEAGHMTKDIADERARINGMFPDERLLAFVKPGTAYPEGKNQVSNAAIAMIKEHYIAMRNTGGEVDTLPPENIYSVKSLMGTASGDYTNLEKYHTAQYWINQMDSAIEKKGMLVYLFHDINADESRASGNTTAQSRVEMLFSAIYDRIEAGKIWNGKFDEIMQYTQEFDAITGVKATNYPKEKKISVNVTDSISKIDTDLVGTKFEGLDMFDYPITVKVELPYDWEYAELKQEYGDRTEILKPFTENGVRYIYANVVPDQKDAVIYEANPDNYITEVKINGAPDSRFEPSKFYYKYVLPYGTSEAPEITVNNENAEIQQAELNENGEGSAFVTLGNFRYEFYFCTQKAEKIALLRIDTANDDANLTATKKVLDYLQSVGGNAGITDKKAYDKLAGQYANIELCAKKDDDNLAFDIDDEYTEKTGDYMPDFNSFAKGLKEQDNDKIIMTMHPEEKSDLLFDTFKDQIDFLTANNVMLVSEKYFYGDAIYVLAIGNSFSDDSVRRLREIAAADGVNIKSYSAYVAGRPLSSHYSAWVDDTDYRIDIEGASKFEVLGTVHEMTTLKKAVAKYDWDYITLQGTTHYNSYDEGLWGVDAAETEKYWTTLTDGVSEIRPKSKRLVNATWSPINELAAKVNDGMFENGTPDARGAYLTALLPHMQEGADIYSTETGVDGKKAYIPVAVAVDYLVRHYHFPEYVPDGQGGYDNSPETIGVYRDTVCHLTNNVGRVLAGLVWYEMLTGTPATENKYQRSTLSNENMAKLKEAAHYACQNYTTYNPASIGALTD